MIETKIMSFCIVFEKFQKITFKNIVILSYFNFKCINHIYNVEIIAYIDIYIVPRIKYEKH